VALAATYIQGQVNFKVTGKVNQLFLTPITITIIISCQVLVYKGQTLKISHGSRTLNSFKCGPGRMITILKRLRMSNINSDWTKIKITRILEKVKRGELSLTDAAIDHFGVNSSKNTCFALVALILVIGGF
jgi:hypothetical protein